MASENRSMELKAALKDYISKNRLKSSRQRDIVAETFFESGGHSSVDDLLQMARGQDPKISQATVYRTMKLLTEAGLAETRNFFDSQTLYEASLKSQDHHDHLICTDCGHIFEFLEPKIEALQEKVATEHGFKVTHHRLDLFGSCQRENCEYRSAKSVQK